jgi:DNA-binding transcriptional MocR family regulator
VNDNTRRQWERYCDDHPDLNVWECTVLYWLVHMHSAREGFTRPGHRLLVQKTHMSNDGVTSALRSLAARGAIELKEPAVGRLAALWTIPWLLNLAPRQQGARQGARQGATQGTSSSPTEKKGAPAIRAARERHPSFADQFQAKPRPEIAAYDDCAPDQFLIR